MTSTARPDRRNHAQADPIQKKSRHKRTFGKSDRFADSFLDSPQGNDNARRVAATERHKKPGKRPKLDEALIKRIAGQVKKGNHLRTSVVACGIGYSTFFKWKEKGEVDRAAGKTTLYSQFLDEMDHADAVAQQRLLRTVIDEGGWKGSLEILKRRWPKEFGDKTALTHGGDGTPIPIAGGAPVTVNFKFDQVERDNPWKLDPSALPPAPEDDTPTDTTTP